MTKPTLSIDFDNTINPYTLGWNGGEVYDGHAIPGTKAALEALSKRYRLVVLTARTDFSVVRQALKDWDLDQYVSDVSNVKQPSVAYVDDKAIQFKNWDDALVQLERLTGEAV